MRIAARLMLTLTAPALALAFVACGDGDASPEITAQNEAARTPVSTASEPADTPTPEEGRFGGGPVDISIFDLRIGDCIADPSEAPAPTPEADELEHFDRITVVPCDDPTAIGRVSNLVLVEDPPQDDTPYPGEPALDEMAAEECAIEGPFSYFIPIEPGWEAGDRTITCIEDLTLRYTVGACLNESNNAVPCEDAEANVEVTGVVDLTFEWPDDAEYPGEDYFGRIFERRCAGDDTYYLYPSELSWQAGDREVVCARALGPRS